MKNVMLALCMVGYSFTAMAQEINLIGSQFTTAGISSIASNVTISRWSLGEVPIFTLQNNDLTERRVSDWSLNSYPNPFNATLNLQLQSIDARELQISVTDVLGRHVYLNKKETLLNNEAIELDLSHLKPSLYILTAFSTKDGALKVIKIQKSN